MVSTCNMAKRTAQLVTEHMQNHVDDYLQCITIY